MKRLSALLIALLLMPGLMACAFGGRTPGAADGAEFCGKVISVSEGTALITGTGETPGLVAVPLGDTDIEDAGGKTVSADSLVPGMTVSITYGGQIMESYPMQLGAPEKIGITGTEDDMVGFWMTVINDLWEIDPGLNSDISVIALNLAEAQNLTDGEKEALVYLVGSEFGIQGISGTFEELCEEGYIDKEQLCFENGILLTLEVTGTGDGRFTFNAAKWRSGTGAYFYSDCTAIKGSSVWSYTVGSEAIS